MVKAQNRDTAMLQLRLLLLGIDESGFLYLRDLLARIHQGQIKLDRAQSVSEVLTCLARVPYNMILCEYHPGEGVAMALLSEISRGGYHTPVAFLGDHVDEAVVKAAIRAGSNGHPGAAADNSPAARALYFAIDLYCKERQRRIAEGTLRKLWRAVEQTADLVMIADCSGVVEYVNPAFETATGYSRLEAIGRSLRMLKPRQLPPGVFREMWANVMAGNSFQGTVLNRKKNGETFVAEKAITPLRDPDGNITHFISTDRDVTERHRLESQLQQAQKMDAIGRLAGGVAHDFNNLLMVISAYAELMGDALTEGHPLRRNVGEIRNAASRAADLTRQLLAFGRKQVQSLQVLDLNSVIAGISRMLARLMGEDIELVVLAGADIGRIKADPIQIEQVLMNLAANARDAMPRGGKLTLETGQVHLEAADQRHPMMPAGEYVMLAVTDVGQGIAPRHLAHIFEPFYTTKEKGKGTGLGLATVYGIVKQSGGFIWVYSEPGLGTTFKIYLPQVWQDVRKPRPSATTDETECGTETVLLVEDETAVRKSESEFLTLCGYSVLEAEHGDAALAVARNFPGSIDLMVSDVVMPHLGGPDLADRLARERPQLKVLFVSGYAEKTVLLHGAIDITANFLQKPFTLKSLAHKIREVLGSEEATALATASSDPAPSPI